MFLVRALIAKMFLNGFANDYVRSAATVLIVSAENFLGKGNIYQNYFVLRREIRI